jgi:phage tail sheath protein FI
MVDYLTPGVYIEEVTGPGVIAGVSTSNAAFVGPAARGPMGQPRLITSLDEYIAIYGGVRDNRPTPYLFSGNTPLYMGFGVEGFYLNGGQYAYVVRVGTAAQAERAILNRDNPAQPVAIVRAIADGDEGNGIRIAVERGAPLPLATGTANVLEITGPTPGEEVRVDRPGLFAAGDVVEDDTGAGGKITRIDGATLLLDAPVAPNAATIRIADLAAGATAFRLRSTFGLRAGQTAILDDGTNDEPVEIQNVDVPRRIVTLTAALANGYDLTVSPTLEPINLLALADATAQTVAGDQITLPAGGGDDYRVGDVVTDGTSEANVTAIDNDVLTVDADVSGWGTSITLAPITPARTRFRVAETSNLVPGTVARLVSAAGTDYVVVLAVDTTGFVDVDPGVQRTATHALDGGAGSEPELHREDFALVVTPPVAAPPGSPPAERHDGLALNPFHPRYVFNVGVVDSEWVTVDPPDAPPDASDYPDQLAAAFVAAALVGGQDDQPTGISAAQYQDGLDALVDVDDVNILCVPDAAAHPDHESIQTAMIGHCLRAADRFAVLDSGLGAPPSGPGSVDEQRDALTAERGFAALYYPWLQIRDPRSTGATARRMFVPPSGHVAGVYARVDAFPGVHKAPGNVDVRGALGLERKLSDRQQGPLNRQGVNVLRIFPGDRRVIVWGARTTVDPVITDWLYVNVRRLMLYLEESIQEGIRWAVFQPNDLTLWQQLRRSIGDFLTGVWRDGALFGATPEEAFQVRIDAALNPPSVRALGRLNIEIKVAPVRPAEFIVVRIGLWDGGGEVNEG